MKNSPSVTSALGSRYTDIDRREAAVTYLITCNLRATAKQTGVNERTLADWVGSDWWDDLLQTLHAEKGIELDFNMSQIIDRCPDKVGDRLANGDHKIGKDNNLVGVPIAAKDAAIIAAVMFDKRQIIRNMPTAIHRDTGHLQRVAANLIAGLKAKKQRGVGEHTRIQILHNATCIGAIVSKISRSTLRRKICSVCRIQGV